MRIVWLMLAGGAGAVSRYGLTIFIQQWLSGAGSKSGLAQGIGTTFPLGTLIINVCGSLFLAFITVLALQEMIAPELRLILGTGFLGAFTTFSTFELESQGLLANGQWTQAALYILGNLLLGFAAIMLGSMLALRLSGGFVGNH